MKRKKFSFINVFGLAIGMASALLILTYVTFEFSFDKMHTKYPHIYRVQSTFREGEVLTDNSVSYTHLKKMNIHVEMITEDDAMRLLEFDALFIRTTTSLNHYCLLYTSRCV